MTAMIGEPTQMGLMRRAVMTRSVGWYVGRWGCTPKQIILRHGSQVRPEELDVLALYAPVVSSVTTVRSRRRLNALLQQLARLASLPSRFAKRLARFLLLALVKLEGESPELPQIRRDDDITPRPERPLVRAPQIQQNAPNA